VLQFGSQFSLLSPRQVPKRLRHTFPQLYKLGLKRTFFLKIVCTANSRRKAAEGDYQRRALSKLQFTPFGRREKSQNSVTSSEEAGSNNFPFFSLFVFLLIFFPFLLVSYRALAGGLQVRFRTARGVVRGEEGVEEKKPSTVRRVFGPRNHKLHAVHALFLHYKRRSTRRSGMKVQAYFRWTDKIRVKW